MQPYYLHRTPAACLLLNRFSPGGILGPAIEIETPFRRVTDKAGSDLTRCNGCRAGRLRSVVEKELFMDGQNTPTLMAMPPRVVSRRPVLVAPETPRMTVTSTDLSGVLILSITRALRVASMLLLLAPSAFGQVLNFRHYGVDEGLPHGIVYAIEQDRQGYLWFGTQDGLCRFDGVSMKVYSREDGLRAIISEPFVK